MSQEFTEKFERFEANKQKLLEYFSQAEKIIAPYKQDTEIKQLDDAAQKLKDQSFKTLVIGEFKRGKSTFINALLGEEVLPAFATPCTAVINEVKYGDKPRAILHFNNPLPKELPEKLTPEVVAHINKYKSSGKIPPMEIEKVKDIEKYVVIPDPGKDHSKQVAETPFALVELYWPLELCKNNVEVIDSPGLNEHKSRTAVTENYISKVDAIIFVLSCDMLGSESEMGDVDNLRNSGFEDIFFVCNRFDQVRPRERDRVKQYAIEKLSEKTSLDENEGIHFVSSADALDAKLEITDPDELKNALTESGFLQVERSLITFLTVNRGKIKILQPGRELRRILIKMLDDVMPSRLKMYDQEVEELRTNYENSKPELQNAKDHQQDVLRKVELQQERFARNVRDSFKGFMREQIDMIPTWIKNHQFQNTLSIKDVFNLKPQIEKVSRECMNVIQANIESQVQKWQTKELKPLLQDFIEEVQQQTKQDLQKFYDSLSKIKKNLNLNVSHEAKEIGTLERVLAAAGGFFIGGLGSAVSGGALGMDEMLKGLIPQIGVALAMIMLGFTNPLILIPTLLASGTVQTLLGLKGQSEKIKSLISEKAQQQLRENLSEQSTQIAEDVKAKSDELRQQINLGMENEIKSLEENVQAALIKMENEKVDKEAEKAKVEEDMVALRKLRDSLVEMILSY